MVWVSAEVEPQVSLCVESTRHRGQNGSLRRRCAHQFPVACRPSIGPEGADLDGVMRDGNKGDTAISKVHSSRIALIHVTSPRVASLTPCMRTSPPQTRNSQKAKERS